MADATRSTESPTRDDSFRPAVDWSTTFADGLLQAQRVQLEALISWQQSIAEVNSELWDEWVCRWAGGVPIDA